MYGEIYYRCSKTAVVDGVNMEKILTVVVPTYNTEHFLTNCLDSLINCDMAEQTEIIIVNDGSKDRSGIVAEKYAISYPNIIKIVHKKNGGHGSAINTGIDLATGRYFKVVDSDDMVDSFAYDKYLRSLENLDCDLVATPFTCVWFQNDMEMRKQKIVKQQKRKIEGADKFTEGRYYSFEEVANRIHIRMHEWTIRTAILKEHHIRLMENSFYVDMQYILYPVPWIQNICILSDNVYRYRLGIENQSVSIKNMQKNREQHWNVLCTLILFYKERAIVGDKKEILTYLAKGIAKMQANEIQTILSLPFSKETRQELLIHERYLKKECLAAYYANQKFSVWLLRWSNYLLYPMATLMWKITRKRV